MLLPELLLIPAIRHALVQIGEERHSRWRPTYAEEPRHADLARSIAPGDSRRGIAVFGAAGLSHGLAKERQSAVSFTTGRIQASEQIPGRHADRPRPPGASITEPEIAARANSSYSTPSTDPRSPCLRLTPPLTTRSVQARRKEHLL